jgi:hypothetical protein
VVGPGVLLRVQLINAATNQPVTLAGGGRVLVAPQHVGGPRMQYESQPEATVSPDGKFGVRLRPGVFRLVTFVYEGQRRPGNEPAFATPDDVYAVGPTITGDQGDARDVQLKVWPMADIEAKRSAMESIYKAIGQGPRDDEARRKIISELTRVLQRYPNDHSALLLRAGHHSDLGQYGEAIADLERTLSVYPGDLNAVMRLADIFATCPDAEFRGGTRAVQLATRLLNATREQGLLMHDARFLAILAASHAEAGDFATAVAMQKDAVAAANDERRADMEARLKLYEAGKPYHREAPTMK